MDPPLASWTLFDTLGLTMVFMETPRPLWTTTPWIQLNFHWTSLELRAPWPTRTFHDPHRLYNGQSPWPSWTLHYHHGPSVTCMDIWRSVWTGNRKFVPDWFHFHIDPTSIPHWSHIHPTLIPHPSYIDPISLRDMGYRICYMGLGIPHWSHINLTSLGIFWHGSHILPIFITYLFHIILVIWGTEYVICD